MVSELSRSGGACAVHAAEDLIFLLHAVSNYAAATMRTSRREPLYRAFETVKNMGLSFEGDFESFVVVISADLAFSHFLVPPVTSNYKIRDSQRTIVRFR
jgi:hypothetical protein